MAGVDTHLGTPADKVLAKDAVDVQHIWRMLREGNTEPEILDVLANASLSALLSFLEHLFRETQKIAVSHANARVGEGMASQSLLDKLSSLFGEVTALIARKIAAPESLPPASPKTIRTIEDEVQAYADAAHLSDS